MFVIPGDLADEVNERLDCKLEDVNELTDKAPDYQQLEFQVYPWHRPPTVANCILAAYPIPVNSEEGRARAEIVINATSYQVMYWRKGKHRVNLPTVTTRYDLLIPRRVAHVRSS